MGGFEWEKEFVVLKGWEIWIGIWDLDLRPRCPVFRARGRYCESESEPDAE